jgi:cytidylate kinase
MSRRLASRSNASGRSPALLGEVINLSGPPGAGKTTVGRLLAEQANPGVHIDGDLLMLSIRRGFVLPWLPGSGEQNRTVITAIAAAAASFARGGYFVVVDALIGPWFLDAFCAPLDAASVPIHYAILRPPLEIALPRAQARTGNALTDEEPIRQLWQAFQDLGPYESHVVDLVDNSADAIAARLWREANEGRFRLKP